MGIFCKVHTNKAANIVTFFHPPSKSAPRAFPFEPNQQNPFGECLYQHQYNLGEYSKKINTNKSDLIL